MGKKKDEIVITLKKTEVQTSSDFKQEVAYALYNNQLFKQLFIASSPIGICFLALQCTLEEGVQELKKQFPKALLMNKETIATQEVAQLLNEEIPEKNNYTLHLIGTPFQQKVWKALLDIPRGETRTYQEITQQIDYGKAFRAVGSAIGRNPISLLVPCHRVVRTNKGLGGFRWGLDVKKTLLSYESQPNKTFFHFLLAN